MKKKNVRSIVAGILVLFLIIGFGVITPPRQAEAFSKTLRFAEPVPPQSFLGKMHQWWASEVEKRTNGRIKIQFFWMESLVKWKDMLEGINSGIADLGVLACGYNPSDFPLFMTVDMPYNISDYWAGMRAVIDTVKNDPNLVKEFQKAGVKHVAPYCSGFFELQTRKPFKGLKDLKGKTIRCFGGARVKFYECLGFNPVFLAYPEIYEAMDRGTIFGYGLVIMLSDAFKIYEVGDYAVQWESGCNIGSGMIGMNMDTWNGLPKDIQDIILDLGTDFAAEFARVLMDFEKNAIEKWKKHGVTFGTLSAEDMKFAKDCGKTAREAFLNKQEAGGHPAKATWNLFQKNLAKYETELKTKGYPWKRK